jgi:NAD(P)-dependent dehydrogenase (short-subunit alcohol dehydrogenase family)
VSNQTKSDKVAFITGGARGIGFETARQLGKQGFTVVLGVRDAKKGDEAVKTLQAEGIKAEKLVGDINTGEGRDAIRAALESAHGKLDVLVNNAGIHLEPEAAPGSPNNNTSRVGAEILRQTFEVNFFTPVQLTQALLPLLRKAPAARVVNLSSGLGSLTFHSDPEHGIYGLKPFAYDSSKTALNAFTVHLAQELRDTKIKVNSAHPGWVKTDMGGSDADLDLSDGAKTSVELATLPADGPSGGFFHLGQPLPW